MKDQSFSAIEVIGVNQTALEDLSIDEAQELCRAARRVMARIHHPDHGGRQEYSAEINNLTELFESEPEAFRILLDDYRQFTNFHSELEDALEMGEHIGGLLEPARTHTVDFLRDLVSPTTRSEEQAPSVLAGIPMRIVVFDTIARADGRKHKERNEREAQEIAEQLRDAGKTYDTTSVTNVQNVRDEGRYLKTMELAADGSLTVSWPDGRSYQHQGDKRLIGIVKDLRFADLLELADFRDERAVDAVLRQEQHIAKKTSGMRRAREARTYFTRELDDNRTPEHWGEIMKYVAPEDVRSEDEWADGLEAIEPGILELDHFWRVSRTLSSRVVNRGALFSLNVTAERPPYYQLEGVVREVEEL